MKKSTFKSMVCLGLFGLSSLSSFSQSSSFPYSELQIANYEAELSHKNGSFIENRGQLGVFGQPDVSAKEVMFYSAQPDFFDFVLRDRLAFVSAIANTSATDDLYDVNRLDLKFFDDEFQDYKTLSPSTHLIRHAKRHFYTGLAATGIENVREIGELHFKSLYNGVDMSLTHNRAGLKALFRIAKGINPSTIKIEFDGLTALNFSGGNVNIGSYQSTYQFHKPVAYQIDNSDNVLFLSATYMVDGNGRMYFNVLSYDVTKPVFVSIKQGNDPVIAKDLGDNLEWSSYIGEAGATSLNSVTTDEQGNVYYSGMANDIDFAANIGFSPNVAYTDGGDAFLIKFNENIEPQWYTFLGGDNSTAANVPPTDRAFSITTYVNNEIAMVGTSGSTDLPMTDLVGGGYSDPVNDVSSDPDCLNCVDLFYARFNSSGILQYSTYYGGPDLELPMEVINKNGSAYIVGERSASTPLQSQSGASNYTAGTGFIMKMDINNQLVWFNSFEVDRIMTATKNENNELIIGGYIHADKTLPSANPSTNPDFNAHNGEDLDGFIAVFNQNDVLTHTAYYGGNCQEVITDLTTDFSTNITYGVGTAFADPGDFCPNNGTGDIPIIGNGLARASFGGPDHVYFKFSSPQPSTPINFTLSGYFSGDVEEFGRFQNFGIEWTRPSIAVFSDGAFAISGASSSGNIANGAKIPFPIAPPNNFYYESNHNTSGTQFSHDAYIAVFDDSDVLTYTTFFGHGRYIEGPAELSYCNVNGVNRLYFAGNTGTINAMTTPPSEVLFTEPYESLTGSLYNDYFRNLGPIGQVGINKAAWGSFMTMDGLYDIGSTNGLNEFNSSNNFIIYPNPTIEEVNIESSEVIRKIIVYSMDGRVVSQQEVNAQTIKINTSTFSKGNYIIKVYTESSIGYSKLIKK
jgi:hypothetical protein